MIKKRVLIFPLIFLSIFLTLTLVNAKQTPISIKSENNADLYLRIESSQREYIESYPKKADSKGELSFTFTSLDSLNEFDILVTLRRDGQKVKEMWFRNNPTAEPLFIIFIPGVNMTAISGTPKIEPQNQTNQTQQAQNITNETKQEDKKQEAKEDEKSNASTTGFSIKDIGSKLSSKLNWKIVLYTIIAILALVFLFFFGLILKRKYKESQPLDNIKIIKASSRFSYSEEKSLREAERKIKEAQSEIDRIKNKDKLIKEAEKRLEQDKLELERLKRRY